MEDMQALPGFIELASDPENDIRSRAGEPVRSLSVELAP